MNNPTVFDGGQFPKPGSAPWYRKRAEEVRYNGKTVSQYNYFLGIAEAIELTERIILPSKASSRQYTP